jgi:glycosyltransferase involved in cell wall biosynthesis
MQAASRSVERLGRPYLRKAPSEVLYWRRRRPKAVKRLLRDVLRRRPKGVEKTAENIWAIMAGFYLARRFLEEGVEHIHAPWASGPATAAWVASRLTGIPFSFTGRAWDIHPPDNLLIDKLNEAQFVRSETGYNIPYLASLAPAAADKLHLTYNGVPLQADGRSPVALQSPVHLMALGRFVGKKGYGYLLEAVKILEDQGVSVHLTLAGDGPLAGKLKETARRLGLDGRVDFPGFVTHDRVGDLFRAADIFVMPSVVDASGDRDGIPLVLMEAMLHGLPATATDVAGIPELVEDQVTGLLIPQRDAGAIAEAVRRLASDRDFALTLAENGRRRVLGQFNPDQNYRRVLDLFSDYHAQAAAHGG